MNKLKEILKEMLSDGTHISCMRIMAIFSLVVGAGIGIYAAINRLDLTGASALCGIFVGSAFGAKAIQSFSEKE